MATIRTETSTSMADHFRILLPSSRGFCLHHTTIRQDSEQVRERAFDVIAVLRFQRELDHVLGVADLRIRTEQELGKRSQRVVQELRDRSLALARVHDPQVKRVCAKALTD